MSTTGPHIGTEPFDPDKDIHVQIHRMGWVGLWHRESGTFDVKREADGHRVVGKAGSLEELRDFLAEQPPP